MWLLVNLFLFLHISEISAEPCTTKEGEQGDCVFMDYCPPIIKLLTNLTNVNNETFSKFACNNKHEYVCCTTPRTSTVVYGKELSDRRYCGLQHTDDYVFDGESASIDEFPWLAAIVGFHKVFHQKGIICHGALINTRYVLTAAQCFDDKYVKGYDITEIVLGEYQISTKTDCIELPRFQLTECTNFEKFQIEEVVKHPFFISKSCSNDMALVRLNRGVIYSDYIRPICLPVQGTTFAKPDDILYTTGWGKKSFSGNISKVKKKIQTILLTNKECSERYDGVEIEYENYMCTMDLINNTAYTCTGDSGAPVMFKHRNQWHIEGIVSQGKRCGQPYPVVHTRVASYLEWIKQNIRPSVFGV